MNERFEWRPTDHKAWVVSADMGYGHQRAAYPLANIAHEKIITANSDKVILPSEKRQWMIFRILYEGLGRARELPLVGNFLWNQYDRLQHISPFYPLRDLSAPTFASRYLHWLIRGNFLRSLVEYVKKEPGRPFVTTFFAPALAAAHWRLPEVFCVVTDSDINRIWVPKDPGKDRVLYLTPTERATRRLMQYGVPERDIFFTGFPLPPENLGGRMDVLKADVAARLPNLDPTGEFLLREEVVIRRELGDLVGSSAPHPLTITFAVGGAGAQKEIGAQMVRSLRDPIAEGRLRVNLITGTHLKISWYYTALLDELGLSGHLGEEVRVLSTLNKPEYFRQFNEALHTTDVLWTKPSELSFYAALGIPLIITPPLGAHERYNEDWLRRLGAGIPQEDPRYAKEWFFEWLERGDFAEAAWNGYLKAPKNGSRNIKNVIFAVDREKVRRELTQRRGNVVTNGEHG